MQASILAHGLAGTATDEVIDPAETNKLTFSSSQAKKLEVRPSGPNECCKFSLRVCVYQSLAPLIVGLIRTSFLDGLRLQRHSIGRRLSRPQKARLPQSSLWLCKDISAFAASCAPSRILPVTVGIKRVRKSFSIKKHLRSTKHATLQAMKQVTNQTNNQSMHGLCTNKI